MFHTSVFNRAAIACAALIITALPLAANAGEVNNRIHNEQARINQGVSSGQLTRGEYMNVETRLQRINANRRRDLRANGGRLTVAERHNLNARENHLSNSIYFDKHNRAHQPGA
ncbi:MAG: hypothetical protein ABSB70_08385 [Candidatus Velthaea sp.]|jgi:hypothetical protein